MHSPYDAFAWFYDRYWAAPLQAWEAPALEHFLYSRLRPGALILDLCCGAGHLARDLVSRGFRVVGVDASQEMLRFAAEKAPAATFVHADATAFTLPGPVDAAVCVFDSLNHVLREDDLQRVFQNVSAALKPGGLFVFDLNTPVAYGERWGHTFAEVQPDHAFFLRGRFDPSAGVGATQITMFRLLDTWRRCDTEVLQRPWEPAAVERMLRASGFTDIVGKRALEELGMSGHYGLGRVFFCACSNLNKPGKS